MILNAKEFSSSTGFPLAMIRRLCRNGHLPHWKCGRAYLLDKDQTVTRLALFKENVPAAPVCKMRRAGGTARHDTDGPRRLREILKRRKAGD